jgi:2',3'-cyclic-nucleotide 2'-phosphodiesterase (5'-nucleotidase family)
MDAVGVAALQNGGGMRDDEVVPPGPITELKTFDILPFANFVAVVPEVPRETFKLLLENAVSRVEAVDGRFAQIGGFPFTALGISYQQALRNCRTGPLGGMVTAAQYPAGGEGRITTV